MKCNKKILTMLPIGIILIITLTGCSSKENDNKQSNETTTEQMETNIIVNDNTTQKNVKEIKHNAIESNEITISEFSTQIYNKEEERQTNIRITCKKLNGFIVEKGETFSFESVVGKATAEQRL